MSHTYNYSIIIPHYDIPELLGRCLKSIPVREDVQVIVVDDGSKCGANLPELCSELKRPQVEYYHEAQHTNAGHARNVGLDHAQGKWLIFADADDYFVDDFNAILDKYVNEEADILFFKNKEINSGIESEAGENDLINNCLETGDDYLLRQLNYCPWGKIIRRQMVEDNKIRFHEVQFSNDVYFSCACGCYARTVKCIDHYLYYYVRRAVSLSSHMLKKGDMRIRVDEYFAAQQLTLQLGWKVNKPLLFRFASFALTTNDFRQWCHYLGKIHKEFHVPFVTILLWSIFSLVINIYHLPVFNVFRNNRTIQRLKQKILKASDK